MYLNKLPLTRCSTCYRIENVGYMEVVLKFLWLTGNWLEYLWLTRYYPNIVVGYEILSKICMWLTRYWNRFFFVFFLRIRRFYLGLHCKLFWRCGLHNFFFLKFYYKKTTNFQLLKVNSSLMQNLINYLKSKSIKTSFLIELWVTRTWNIAVDILEYFKISGRKIFQDFLLKYYFQSTLNFVQIFQGS